MTYPLSDVEIAVLHVRQATIAVVEQRERTALLRARGHSTELAEHLLSTLVTGLELTKKHLQLVINHLPGYRFHLIRAGEIEAIHRCMASNDAEAILRVTLVMDSKSADVGAEIWNDERLVMRIPPRTGLR